MGSVGVKATTNTLRTYVALPISSLLICLLVFPVTMKPAYAATFTVNSTADASDADTTDGLCDTDLTTQGDQCTLRAAMEQAEASTGADDVGFNIPETDPNYNSITEVFTIAPSTILPPITHTLAIDGYTQRGASPNTLAVGTNAKLLIEISGVNVESLAPEVGLWIETKDSVVRSLVINRFSYGVLLAGDGNKVEGNYIGTDASGTQDLGNRIGANIFDGLSSNTVTVGGTTAGASNVISGNKTGVYVRYSRGYTVQGNYIGTDASGTQDVGNSGAGVRLKSSSSNTVGGTTAEASNTIAFNGGDGVTINGVNDSSGNRVLSNYIFSNGDLGIDLDNDGPTANDSKDRDKGPNTLQNKPRLDSVTASGGTTTIKGRLTSTPNRTFTIQFFSNGSDNEGRTFIGQRRVTTNDEGIRDFTFSLGQAITVGQNITATATGRGSTSEFSAPKSVTP